MTDEKLRDLIDSAIKFYCEASESLESNDLVVIYQESDDHFNAYPRLELMEQNPPEGVAKLLTRSALQASTLPGALRAFWLITVFGPSMRYLAVALKTLNSGGDA